MQRILNLTASATAPTAPTTGTPGHFTAGNPASSPPVPATVVDAWWLDQFQEEMIAILLAAGVTPAAGTNNQVLSAIQTLIGASTSPSGSISFFAANTPPAGYLAADGSAISRTTYANLFTAIGTTFGTGNGSTTFNLPDLRGQFLRGVDNGRGVDTSRTFGSLQAYAVQSHTHGVTDPTHAHGITDPGHYHIVQGQAGSGEGAGAQNTVQQSAGQENTTANATGITVNYAYTGISIQSTGSSETRPTNVALLACIKY